MSQKRDVIDEQIQEFMQKRVMNRKDSSDITIAFYGIAKAHEILRQEERFQEALVFHGLITAFLLESRKGTVEGEREAEKYAVMLYEQYRDLLARGNTPTCKECE